MIKLPGQRSRWRKKKRRCEETGQGEKKQYTNSVFKEAEVLHDRSTIISQNSHFFISPSGDRDGERIATKIEYFCIHTKLNKRRKKVI